MQGYHTAIQQSKLGLSDIARQPIHRDKTRNRVQPPYAAVTSEDSSDTCSASTSLIAQSKAYSVSPIYLSLSGQRYCVLNIFIVYQTLVYRPLLPDIRG
ncbi:Cytochrome b2 [Fusarium oxysporum f. sp. albedinis]|nr:Cytochrome b2 [Fusarium oxysporum f. sp. albedinis]